MFRYRFSSAFILALCLFWIQIHAGDCYYGDLEFWSRDPKYWTTSTHSYNTVKRTLQRSLRRNNENYKRNFLQALDGVVFESDKDSNVNSYNKIQKDHHLSNKHDEREYFSDSATGNLPKKKNHKKNKSNKEKNTWPKDSTAIYGYDDEGVRGLRSKDKQLEIHVIPKHIKIYKKDDKMLKPIDDLYPESLNLKTKESYKINKRKHKNRGSKKYVKSPLVSHSTYKTEEVTESDTENETKVKPSTDPVKPDSDSNEVSDETKIEPTSVTTNKPVFQNRVVSDFESTNNLNKETTRVGFITTDGRATFKTKKDKKDEIHDSITILNYVHFNNKEAILRGRTEENSAKSKKKEFAKVKYFSPFNIKRQLADLAERFESRATIELEVIGRTVEYNDIVMLKMTELIDSNRKGFQKRKKLHFRSGSKYVDDNPEKKIVFIVHGLNIMGWHKLPCLSEVKKFETLLGFYLDNLDCFDIYLIPMANPDGVQMSGNYHIQFEFEKRFWNKNVSPQKACPGVNLDRNFDVGWNTSYAKMSSCSQQYPGPRPMSEHETRAIKGVLNRFGHKMIAFFHVHSATYDATVYRGDAVLYPKGYTDDQTEDDKYVDFKGELDEAMRNTSFKMLGVTVDTMHSWYGKVIGTSVDYASTVFGIPYSFDFAMQIYDDNTMVTKEEDREQNTALVELWQIVFDVVFSHLNNNTEKD